MDSSYPSNAINILIADQHSLFRREFRRSLESEPGFKVVAETGSALQTVSLAKGLAPSLVIIDMGLPDLQTAIIGIHRNLPKARVVLLTFAQDKEDVLAALQCGVSAQLPKDTPLEKIIYILHAVMRGEVWMTPALTGLMLTKFRQMAESI